MFRRHRPRKPRLTVVDDFRLTWRRLRVLAILANDGDLTVPRVVRRTRFHRSRVSTILNMLARHAFVCRTGLKRRAAPFWTITDKGREALELGLKKRLSRRQSLSVGEAPVILDVASRLDDVLRGWGWQPHLRWEVFRKVPLEEIVRVVDRVDFAPLDIKNAFAYSYACLLGGSRGFRADSGKTRPTRWSTRDRERRRVEGIVRRKPQLYADMAETVYAFMNQARPVHCALQASI